MKNRFILTACLLLLAVFACHKDVNVKVADEFHFCGSLTPPLNPNATGAPSAKGAGATFPDPIYQKWIDMFRQQRPDVNLDYDAIGSEEGLDRLCRDKVAFAGSDWPQDSDARSVVQFPTVAGAVVIIYNVRGIKSDLRLTPDTLAGILGGTITKWSDSRIQRDNSGAILPEKDIVIVHRQDGSGTTRVLSEFLALKSNNWNAGTGFRINWPPKSIGADGNDKVAAVVLESDNSIGYVEYTYALNNQLRHAFIRNNADQFIQADVQSISAALVDLPVVGNPQEIAKTILRDEEKHREAYPIVALTWIVLPIRPENRAGRALTAFLPWTMTSEAQVYVELLGYVKLTKPMLSLEQREIERIRVQGVPQ